MGNAPERSGIRRTKGPVAGKPDLCRDGLQGLCVEWGAFMDQAMGVFKSQGGNESLHRQTAFQPDPVLQGASRNTKSRSDFTHQQGLGKVFFDETPNRLGSLAFGQGVCLPPMQLSHVVEKARFIGLDRIAF
jgi:hypothetical protein